MYLLVSVNVVPGGEKCDQIVTHVPRRRRERARRRRRRGERRRGSRPEEDLELAQSVVGEGRRRKILGGWRIEVVAIREKEYNEEEGRTEQRRGREEVEVRERRVASQYTDRHDRPYYRANQSASLPARFPIPPELS